MPTENLGLKTQDSQSWGMARDCTQCDCAGRVLNGRPDEWVCANHPDHAGQLTVVGCGGADIEDIGSRCRRFRFRGETRGTAEQMEGDQIRYISLTGGLWAIVDAADYEWLSRYKWRVTGSNSGYPYCKIRGKQVSMHRLIMKPPQGMVVDHINGSRQDNRRCNLRVCTQAENLRNRRGIGGTSRFKGVSWDALRRRWAAAIHIKDKKIHIGLFWNEVQAARAYDRKAGELFGAFAYLNFPGPMRIVLLSGRVFARSEVCGRITGRTHERDVPIAAIECHDVPTLGAGMAPRTISFDHRQGTLPCRCHPGLCTYTWEVTLASAWPSWTRMATGPPEGNFRTKVMGGEAVFDKFILEPLTEWKAATLTPTMSFPRRRESSDITEDSGPPPPIRSRASSARG